MCVCVCVRVCMPCQGMASEPVLTQPGAWGGDLGALVTCDWGHPSRGVYPNGGRGVGRTPTILAGSLLSLCLGRRKMSPTQHPTAYLDASVARPRSFLRSAAQLERIVALAGRAPASHCTPGGHSLGLRACGAHHLQRPWSEDQPPIA